MIGMCAESHPSNSWDEAREGVPRSSRERRTQRNSSDIVSSEIPHRRKVEVPRVELHPEFDGWRSELLAAVRFEADARIDGGSEALLDDAAKEFDVVDGEEVGLVVLEVEGELGAQVRHGREPRPGRLVPLEAKAQVPEGAVQRFAVGRHGTIVLPPAVK